MSTHHTPASGRTLEVVAEDGHTHALIALFELRGEPRAWATVAVATLTEDHLRAVRHGADEGGHEGPVHVSAPATTGGPTRCTLLPRRRQRPYKCEACDWTGFTPAGHELVRHDGAQTCWREVTP